MSWRLRPGPPGRAPWLVSALEYKLYNKEVTEHGRRVLLPRLFGPPQEARREAAPGPVPGGRLPGPLRRPDTAHPARGVGLLDRRRDRRAQEVDVGGVQGAALRGGH